MNTKQKGDELENLVYNILKPIVEKGVYGVYAKIFQKKKYPLIDAEKGYKEIDVSIETFQDKEDRDPIFIYAFECKNYNGKLNISEVEEFNTKLSRISYRAIKGAIVTTIGFSKPTVDFARGKQIALIKLSKERTLEYILKREINDTSYYNNSLKSLYGEETDHPILVYYNSRFISILELLETNKIPVNINKLIKIPFIEDKTIEETANSLISKDTQPSEIINTVLEKLQDIKIESCRLPENQLGRFIIKEKNIQINNSLEIGNPRWRFTVAHEIGHYILHYTLLKNKIDSFGESNDSLDIMEDKENGIYKKLEIQANKFASYLLVPTEKLRNKTYEMFIKYDINKGRLYLDYQICNINNYNNVVGEISRFFNVSKQCIRYRMIELKLLEIGYI